MQQIARKIWSHRSLDTNERYSLTDVRTDTPLLVNNYPQLVQAIAKISFQNPQVNLFYRGQHKDYLNGDGLSSLMPSIYRGWGSGRKKRQREMKRRFDRLDQAVDLLKEQFDENKIESKSRVFQFEEVAWAILQHYEITPTLLLDITQSLRVAASFATMGDGDYGYLYALGLPYPNGIISFYADLQMINVRLLGICPPEAVRPYFQDGYLTGTFRHRYRFGYNTKIDFGRRLVAKFKFPKHSFWSGSYSPIPFDALYPANDEIKDLCTVVRANLDVQDT